MAILLNLLINYCSELCVYVLVTRLAEDKAEFVGLKLKIMVIATTERELVLGIAFGMCTHFSAIGLSQ